MLPFIKGKVLNDLPELVPAINPPETIVINKINKLILKKTLIILKFWLLLTFPKYEFKKIQNKIENIIRALIKWKVNL